MSFLFLACISCTQKVDIAKEKEAILKVLQDEGSAFNDRDMERFSSLYITDNTFTRLNNYDIIKGWDEHKKLVQSWMDGMASDTTLKNMQNAKENVIIKIYDNTAWVLCDNKWSGLHNNKPEEWTDRQISFLEKVDGKWKISFICFVPNEKEKIEEQETKK